LCRVLANLQVDAFSGEGPGEDPNPTTPGIRTRKSAARQDQRLEGRDKTVKRKAARASEPKASAARPTLPKRSKGR
jgi:hypothetical protein